MNNNDVLRSIRYTFGLGDDKMKELFAMAGLEVTRVQVCEWLKRDDDPELKGIYDVHLATFLNGFIIDRRGRKDGALPVAEKKLNNNIVFRKLKIALSLKDEDILAILALVDFRISRHELSAFFRDPAQDQYRPCKDQIIRYFLQGLTKKYRPLQKTEE
jgi:uncharacterized protein YehS (DUF1456 family)